MDRNTWKQEERYWASVLGGTRVPVTGRGRGSAPDIEHERFSIEIKSGRVMSVRLQEAVEQAEASKKEGQLALIGITQMYGRGNPKRRYVMMPLDDFTKLLE